MDQTNEDTDRAMYRFDDGFIMMSEQMRINPQMAK